MNSPDAKPDVSILVVAYNSSELIGACLGSIASACEQNSYEVLLIDNGDGTTQSVVERDFPVVRIIESRGNIGFAAGNNVLASHAKSDRLLLLNPDMELCEGAIDALLDGARRHYDAAAWGGVTLRRDGTPDSGNAIAIPSMIEFVSVALGRSLVGSRKIPGIDADEEVETTSGGFVMFDRTAWDQASGFDESYFLYCEEIDLFYRLRKQGHSIWRIAGARGFHDSGHGEAGSPIRMLYKMAGTIQFLRLHWPLPARAIATFLVWISAVERYLAGYVLSAWKPSFKSLAETYSQIATRPLLWIRGYHKTKGLLPSLAKSRGAK